MQSEFQAIDQYLRILPDPVFSGTINNIDDCPKFGGIYLVAIALDKAVLLQRPKADELAAGLYCYAGSAHGPGGLQARLGRHLRKDKKVRWHVDQLTLNGSTAAWGWKEGIECDLISKLQELPNISHPISGFGSSDCRNCQSHLLQIDISNR